MYNKLFGSILDSSIWLESHTTRIVFLTFLAAMDGDGFAKFSAIGNLAARARVTKEEAEEAVKILEAPDPDSASQDHDGRRVERVPGGWMVLNAAKYREIGNKEEERRQTRLRVQAFRNRAKGNVTECNGVECYSALASASEYEYASESPEGGSAEGGLPKEAAIWNAVDHKFPKVVAWNQSRQKHLAARRKDAFWVANFEEAVKKAASSPFCNGENAKGWRLTFDWLLERPGGLAKVIEGNYEGGGNGNSNSNDTFWKLNQEYKLVGEELKKIRGRASETATGFEIEAQDRERWEQLKKRKAELKKGLRL